MYKYKSDSFFLKVVKSGDKNGVKNVIASLLLTYKGDRRESDAAIEYAASQGAFEWDTHDGKEIPSYLSSIDDRFNYEKGALKRNFSKDRYERVLVLLEEYLKNREPQRSINTEEKREKINQSVGGRGPEVTLNTESSKERKRQTSPQIYQKEKNFPLPLIIAVGLGVITLLILIVKVSINLFER